MNIHEYQAKKLLAKYGVPIPKGGIAHSATEAIYQASELGGNKWIVKAQLHSGARGKAGGVKLCNSHQEIAEFCDTFLGNKLVTHQTGPEGKMVSSIYVEEASDIAKELYFSIVLDRATQKVTLIASTEGGMDIEKVAEETPEKILKAIIDPVTGAQPYQGRDLAFKLGLKGVQIKQFVKIFMGLAKLFKEKDLELLEVNPLVITDEGNLHCLDAKVIIDGNAMYRQPQIKEMHDPSQEDAREAHASAWDLNYVALDGDIGCMVNGAGLAMGTMDIVNLHGGSPANFLDVGGGATKERVTEAFKIILSDPAVKGILVNIFGGIMRCDVIADGVVAAAKELSLNVPLVVRLEGTNVEKGKEIMNNSGLNIIAASDLGDAAVKIVKAVEEAN